MPGMRLVVVSLISVLCFVSRLEACSCASSGTPCDAAGAAAAAFTSTVMDITVVPAQIPANPSTQGRPLAGQRPADAPRIKPGYRVVRMQVTEVLNGIAPWQREIEIVTAMGGGDCGYPFERGIEYVVYASKDSEGRLQTSICSRTKPLAQAAEDLRYFQSRAGGSTAGEMRVRTGFAGVPGRSGVSIVAEREGLRYRAVTNTAGDAVFTDLPAGEYQIHEESDGDLPDDPKVRLSAKGCRDIVIFRTLRIAGRVMTKDGLPAARVEVQAHPTSQIPAESRMTNPDGYYELRIVRPGQYYLGINLNHAPTRDTPYPRWFYPGTEDPSAAAIINFSGKPASLTYDITLPDRQSEREIDGIVLTSEHSPMPRARVMVYESADHIAAQAFTDAVGRFQLRVFADTAYRLHAVWPNTPEKAVSAVPVDIPPGTEPLSLHLILEQPGNSVLQSGRKGPGL
jgi:hypothetical protein